MPSYEFTIIINQHFISIKVNYIVEDMSEILKSDVFKHKDDKEIELGLNKVSDFWSLEEFKEMLETKKETISKIKLLLKNRKYHISDEILYIDDKIRIRLRLMMVL